MKEQNRIMNILRLFGMDSLAWSLRRFYCPVNKDDLVLEIGGGNNPYSRANVLCDAYLNTVERHYEPLASDRKTVLAFGEKLPFKNNAFDFVIASHVLEHSVDPEKFLNEIQRVGRAGYIETPAAIFERFFNYPMHRLEVCHKNGELVIRKKIGPTQDLELAEMISLVSTDIARLVSQKPFDFHVRYYWNKKQGGINFRIVNPGYSFDWQPEDDRSGGMPKMSIKETLRRNMIKMVRFIFSQNKRNKKIKLIDYLVCPECLSGISEKEDRFFCVGCQRGYNKIKEGLVDFIDYENFNSR